MGFRISNGGVLAFAGQNYMDPEENWTHDHVDPTSWYEGMTKGNPACSLFIMKYDQVFLKAIYNSCSAD